MFYKFTNKKSIVVCFTILFVFLSLEAVLRVRMYLKYGMLTESDEMVMPDKTLGNVLRPLYKIDGRSSSLSINSLGFRGKEFTRKKAPGVYRIFVVGDSVVFDRFAHSDQTAWTARLEKKLNKIEPFKFEIINAGVTGYNMETILLYIKEKVIPFHPDMILLYAGANDINNKSHEIYGPKKTAKKAYISFSLSRLREKYLVWFQILRAKTSALLASEDTSSRIDSIDDSAIQTFSNTNKKIIKYCRANDVKIVISTIARSFTEGQPKLYQLQMASAMMAYNPYLSLTGINDAFDRMNIAIKELGLKYGVPIVDAAAIIPPEKKFFRDHVHFNDAGEIRISDIFSQKLARQVLILDKSSRAHKKHLNRQRIL